MLRLVAEQARELVDADCCVATVGSDDHPRAAEAASHAEGSRWAAFVRWLDLSSTYRLLRASGGSIRAAGEELAGLPHLRSAVGRPLRSWLAASLTALDGSGLGAIQLFDKDDGALNADDERALIHLAKMAPAAVDRARFYEKPR